MKGQKLWIRATTPDDAADLSAFYVAEQLTEPSPFGEQLIARLAGSIVAHALWRHDGDAFRIEHLYVAAGLRRKRIGRGVLAEIEKLAAAVQCRSLVAGATCPAAGYLLKRGFERRGELLFRELSEDAVGG